MAQSPIKEQEEVSSEAVNKEPQVAVVEETMPSAPVAVAEDPVEVAPTQEKETFEQTPLLNTSQSTDLIEDSSFKGTDLLDVSIAPVFTMPEIKQQMFTGF
jgi:hypothetical protein